MELRNYLDTDANEILKWIKDERAFRLWSANRYKTYPIKSEDINNNYKECMDSGIFYPMTLVDNNKIIGHIILRSPSADKKDVVRFGFIIVDSSLRGKGYGKKLIQEAIKYAKNELQATEINLGVFQNNDSAYHCYKAAGFKEVFIEKNALQFEDESWNCVEMILED